MTRRPKNGIVVRLNAKYNCAYMHDGHPTRELHGGFPMSANKRVDSKDLGLVVDVYHKRWDEDDSPCDLYYVKLLIGDKVGWLYGHYLTEANS